MEHSSLGRLISVLFSPEKTFRSIAEKPTWLLALLITTLAPALMNAVAFTKVDVAAMLTEKLGDKAELPAEQLEMMVAATKWSAPIMTGVTVVFFSLLGALVLWLIFKVIGGEFSFGRSLSVLTHSSVIVSVGFVLRTIVAAGKESISMDALERNQLLMSNLGFLAGDESSAFVRQALGAFDVFSIWSLVLMTLGYAIIANVSRAKAAAVVGVLWLVATLGGVAISSMAG